MNNPLDYIRNLSNDALRDGAGTVLVLAWIVLAPDLMLLQSRAFYNTCTLCGCIVFAALFAAYFLPPARKLLRQPGAIRCAGTLAFVCGIAAVQLPSTATCFACACAQCALCAVLLQAWAVRLGSHSIRGVFATGFAGTLFAALLWLVMLMTAVTAGIVANTAVFSSALLIVISVLPLASSLLFNAPQADSPEPKRQEAQAASAHLQRNVASASLISTILLCVGLLTSNFFIGTTFNPHLYDLVAIISQGWTIAAVLAAAMCAVTLMVPSSPLRSAPVWLLAAALIVAVTGMLLFVLGQSGTRSLAIAVTMASARILAGLLVPFAVMQARLPERIPLMLACAFIASGYLYMVSLGIHAKQLVGFSVDTLAPLITICIAIPAVFSFVQSAMQMSRAQLALNAPLDMDHLTKAAIEQIDAANAKRQDDFISGLPITHREQDVVKQVAKGLTYEQIAAELDVSKKTVGYHLTNIYRKLDVQGRKELEELVNSNSSPSDSQ